MIMEVSFIKFSINVRRIKNYFPFKAPATYETLFHDLEKGGKVKQQDANSQTVKKV